MKKFKSLPIVLLPTDGKSHIHKWYKNDNYDPHNSDLNVDRPYLVYNPEVKGRHKQSFTQHLYILTDDVIFKGDWVLYGRHKQSFTQHLYILTDDVIFKGDWVLYENPNTQRKLVVKVSSVDGDTFDYERQTLDIREIPLKWAQKIVASTDSSLLFAVNESPTAYPCVQPIPESLIKNYITAFNAKKPITAISVEYTEVVPGRYAYTIIPENTPPVPTEKDNWDREDLEFFKGSSGNHIEWIYQRLVHKHNENPQYDYMIKLKELSNWVAENL